MTYRVYRGVDGRYYEVYDSLKDYCYQRSGGQCEQCGWHGAFEQFHVHHKEPKSQGGGNEPGNLVLLCPTCHGEKHQKASCSQCGNLVPINPHDGMPYWMVPITYKPLCYHCKDNPYQPVEYNLPAELLDGY